MAARSTSEVPDPASIEPVMSGVDDLADQVRIDELPPYQLCAHRVDMLPFGDVHAQNCPPARSTWSAFSHGYRASRSPTSAWSAG